MRSAVRVRSSPRLVFLGTRNRHRMRRLSVVRRRLARAYTLELVNRRRVANAYQRGPYRGGRPYGLQLRLQPVSGAHSQGEARRTGGHTYGRCLREQDNEEGGSPEPCPCYGQVLKSPDGAHLRGGGGAGRHSRRPYREHRAYTRLRRKRPDTILWRSHFDQLNPYSPRAAARKGLDLGPRRPWHEPGQ